MTFNGTGEVGGNCFDEAACLGLAGKGNFTGVNSEPFVPFGVAHVSALVMAAVVGFGFFRLMRAGVGEELKQSACKVLAWVLLAGVAADPLLRWLRYGSLAQVIDVSLPLYLCDVVSVVLAVALLGNRQRWAELGYFWGIAGTTQGLLTPTLEFSWTSLEYYAFFVQHAGVPIAALSLVFGRGLAPEAGAWWRVVRWSWVYLLGVFLINKGLGALTFLHLEHEPNYGFVNRKPAVASLLDVMGPWPWYLLSLQVIAFSLYLLLDLPFRRQRRRVGTEVGRGR